MQKPPPELNVIYIICLILEMLGLCLLAFSLYLIPFVLFDVVYTIPSFIIAIAWWLDMHQHSSILMYATVIFLPFFLAGLLCLLESKQLTMRIEKQMLAQDELSLADRVKIHYSESTKAILRVVFFVALLIGAIWLFAYLI